MVLGDRALHDLLDGKSCRVIRKGQRQECQRELTNEPPPRKSGTHQGELVEFVAAERRLCPGIDNAGSWEP